MLEEIIKQNLSRIENDLLEIDDIEYIDFIDIFPKSEEHKTELDNEISKMSLLIQKTERGNIYLLNNPIKTKYGILKYVKIRIFDESRLNWEAAADFVVEDRDVLMKKVGKDKRFSYIEREEWDAIEFKTNNTLIYFLNPVASEVYGKRIENLQFNFANKWLTELKEAWWNKDIEKATSLFTKTTFYQETPFMKPYTTFDEIKQEWQHIKNQDIKNIEFKILAIDKNILIVEWLFERDVITYDGIYEIKFNDDLECIYFKSWEMEK